MTKSMIMRVIAVLFTTLILTASISAVAYAQAQEPQNPEETQQSSQFRLTPQGNLTLVDDVKEEKEESKQFITAVTKNGNYFYLIIDRSGNNENVYFLNMVDEADLMALMEKDKKTTTVATPEPEPTPEPTPPPEQKSSAAGILVLVLIAAIIGGGAYYYFKVLKPKQDVQGNTDLDELEFEDDDDTDGLIKTDNADNVDKVEGQIDEK